MKNFNFYAPTEMFFGKGEIKNLPNLISRYGKNVLLCYGGGSIKRNGIYDSIHKLLKDCTIIELSGIEPNPRIETVERGIRLCREHNIGVVLAAGGGSTIDCAKVVAAGVCYEGDAWDIVTDPSKIKAALPLVTILTLAATGSEMDPYAVISNMKTNEKIGTESQYILPKASILDPQYLYTVPKYQTAAGTADIMSHVIENYFSTEIDTFVQDKISEGLLEACIKYCPVALEDPENYEARANLMWASSLALNGLTGCGKNQAWSCHPIEHELSAFYDITHGVGLAIITPRWMRYILNDKTVDKFVQYGENVFHIQNTGDKFAVANEAIDKTEQFFKDCKIPMTLKELNIDETHFEKMAEDAVKFGGLQYAYVPLNKNDVINILKESL